MTKRVLITGAASGLGWEFAKQYQARGWHVILLDRDAEKLTECDEQLRVAFRGVHPELRRGAKDAPARDFAPRRSSISTERNTTQFRHEVHIVDLIETEQLDAQLSEVFAQPLDLLINNAGITHRSQASVTDPEVFSRLMAVNWFAPVSITQKCLPALQKASGGVICISSMAARMPVPGRAAYCASKSAMSQHFETWRPELSRRGINLLMVYPSFLSTSIEQNALGSDGQKTTRPRSVVGKIHDPDKMARQIIEAAEHGKQRLYSQQWSSRFAVWLWVRAPSLFQRMMWRKFAVELDS